MSIPTVRILALSSLLLFGGCKTELYAGIPEGEANGMVALLLHHGIDVIKERQKDGSDALLVEKANFADAEDLLREAGFPHKSFETIGDVFKPSGLVASPLQERARFLWALGQELSQTVSDIDGVLTARVQVVLPDDDLLNREPTPSSASVFVRYKAGNNVEKLTPQIKQLVASSVQGLSYDKVSLIMVPEVSSSTDTMRPAAYYSQALSLSQLLGMAVAAAVTQSGVTFLLRTSYFKPYWLRLVRK